MMLRRHGGAFETIEANARWTGHWFDRIHSEAYLTKLAEAGFNCITLHFHKGFGLAAEATEMDLARRTIEACHRLGVRAFAYIQSMSLMSETFFSETPEARQWLQKDDLGRPRTYAEQYWRVLPCLSNRGYIDFVKRVAEKAITWAHADGVWLDNADFLQCACEACQSGFQEYLKARHSSVDTARFGISDLSQVRIPFAGRLYDPVYQEAVRYRCEVVENYVREMRSFVRELNADAIVAVNYGVPAPYNVADVLGVNDSRGLRAADLSLAENGNFPEMRDGRMITQMLAYKAGRTTSTVVVPSHWRLEDADEVKLTLPETPAQVKLTLAESAAFGGRCVGATWACRPIEAGRRTLIERPDIRDAVTRYNRFFARHEQLFLSGKSMARVATYRNFSSQTFAHDEFSRSVLGMEQALIHHHVPFDVLFAEDLDALLDRRSARVLLLCNVICMSDDEVEKIRQFVRAGGGAVLATGKTSLYDEDRRQRQDYGLADVFGVSYADVEPERAYRGPRSIFLPAAPESAPFNHLNYQIRPELPAAHERLIGHVCELDENAVLFRIEGARFVGSDVQRVAEDALVHLVNYDNGAGPLSGVRITFGSLLRPPDHVVQLSPDVEPGSRSLDVARSSAGKQWTIELAQLDTYSLLLLKGACV